MATYLLRNTLNPGKVVGCTITFRQLTVKGEDGDPVWVVEIGTVEPHKDGGSIPPVFIHYTNTTNLDLAIRDATESIARQVDWQPLVSDIKAPVATTSSPTNGEVVSINSNVTVSLQDNVPSSGLDISTLSVSLNGIDITNEVRVSGDPFNYQFNWSPTIRVRESY